MGYSYYQMKPYSIFRSLPMKELGHRNSSKALRRFKYKSAANPFASIANYGTYPTIMWRQLGAFSVYVLRSRKSSA